MSDTQATRRANLERLMNDHHCWPTGSDRPSPKFADYDDTYAEMAGSFLGITFSDDRFDPEEHRGEPESPTPKWAATIYDETYSMIGLYDSLTKALAYSQGNDGEYLTGAGSVFDLDTGKPVEQRTIALTVEAYNVLRVFVESYAQGSGAAEIELREAFNTTEQP